MPHLKRQSLWITLGFAYIYVAWGCTYMATHLALQSLPPFVLAGTRFSLAGCVLLVLLRLFQSRQFYWGTSSEWRDAAIIGLLLLGGGNGGLVWAQQFVPTSISALIFGLVPLCIILFEWLRPNGNRPTLRVAIGLALGFAGLVVLVNPRAGTGKTSMEFWGELVLFVAACFWATGAIASRHVSARGGALLPMARQMIVAGAFFLLVASVRGDWRQVAPGAITPTAALGFAYLVVFGSLLGYTTYVWLMRASTPSRVATIAYVNLVVAVLVGWTLGHEPMTWRVLVGGAIIFVSVILVLTKKTAPIADSPVEA